MVFHIKALLKPNNLPFTGVDKIYHIRQSKKVIIKFTQTDQRNEFFHGYHRNAQPLSALGFNEQGKIYINEVLSRDQSKLFWKIHQFKMDNHFKYVWTYSQHIYLQNLRF